VESLNVANFACNHKKASTTSNARPKICVSSTNEGKTQVEFIAVKQKTWRCVKANNIPPKGSPCHVPNLDEMTMKSLCQIAYEKYCEDRYA